MRSSAYRRRRLPIDERMMLAVDEASGADRS